MYRIFFSHSGKDAEWVTSIQRALQREYSVYLFEDNPQVTGLTIDQEVQIKIKENDLTLVFMSKNSQEPPSILWITKEIAWSEGYRKPLVFIADKETPVEVINVLGGKKRINFDKAQGITQEFLDTLKGSLYAALGQKRLETIIMWAIVVIGFVLFIITYRKSFTLEMETYLRDKKILWPTSSL
jgi:hypothetical protein